MIHLAQNMLKQSHIAVLGTVARLGSVMVKADAHCSAQHRRRTRERNVIKLPHTAVLGTVAVLGSEMFKANAHCSAQHRRRTW